MPIFPNINTLSLKDLLSGKETIQISASERTTLERIAQLAMAQPVAGFISTLEKSLGGTAITTSDSLLAALEKLYARVGGDESALFPITYDVYWGICGILPSSLGALPGSAGDYFLFAILFNSEEGMRPYIWYGNHNSMVLDENNSTPEAIVDWLESNGKHSPLSSPDEFYKSTSSGTLNLSPGRVITCEDQLPNFSLHSSEWVKPYLGGQNFTVSIVSRTNITQSKFTVTNGNPSFPSGVQLLFMEDFDMDPGTEWQAVTVQLFVSGNTYRFFINKCGYNPKNS